MWDGILAKEIEFLDMLQHCAVQFIAKLRGRESVTEACSELDLQPLTQRRMIHRLSLLMKILQDEIARDSRMVTMTTRCAAGRDVTSVHTVSRVYCSSFLPRTIRDTREHTD